MTEPTLHFVACPDADGGHHMAYWQWGAADAPHVVLCVHGLTRQGRDFDELARALLARDHRLRIVCPDIAGRGASDWLRDPQAYQVPTYAADVLALLAQLHAQRPIDVLDYLGTSMGGLIGIVLAGRPKLPLPVPIRRLVLNDVGPAVRPDGIQRIAAYVGRGGHYASLAEGAEAIRAVSAGFGEHTPAQWLALTRPMLVPAAQRSVDGRAKRAVPDETPPYVLHYDPAIAQSFQSLTPQAMVKAEAATWALYDAIGAQTLVVRGAESDLLSSADAFEMTRRGPHARLVEFEAVGHAPTFVAPAQSRVVVDFLLG